MPATISAEAHLFLSKGRTKISLDYLSGLLLLGAIRVVQLFSLAKQRGQRALSHARPLTACH